MASKKVVKRAAKSRSAARYTEKLNLAVTPKTKRNARREARERSVSVSTVLREALARGGL